MQLTEHKQTVNIVGITLFQDEVRDKVMPLQGGLNRFNKSAFEYKFRKREINSKVMKPAVKLDQKDYITRSAEKKHIHPGR